MRRWILLGLCITFIVIPVSTQAQTPVLEPDTPEIIPELDVYGETVLFAEGVLNNTSAADAYANVSLYATAYDADDEVIGEGFGYLVNACNAALAFDFHLQPQAEQRYAIPLELYEADVEVERLEIEVQGEPVEPVTILESTPIAGIDQISTREVVNVEWIDADNFRYAEGCRRDLFYEQTWREYNLEIGFQTVIEHPRTVAITDALRRQLGLEEPLYWAHSFISYDPNGRRMVYQTEINTAITAEVDGSFKRVLFENLYDRTLQGITWLQEGAFIAYYYGSIGDPVTYYTATVDGRVLSEAPRDSTPSLSAPGATPNGRDVILTLEVDGQTGFYRKQAATENIALLFEAPVPPNNWPGPIVRQDADGAQFIYAAIPWREGAWMACYNAANEELTYITSLPMNPGSDERAGWWLSPDADTIALAQDGPAGGLWLLDLNTLDDCG
jgi:hypothetical protein